MTLDPVRNQRGQATNNYALLLIVVGLVVLIVASYYSRKLVQRWKAMDTVVEGVGVYPDDGVPVVEDNGDTGSIYYKKP